MIKAWYSAKEAACLHNMSKLGFIKMAKRNRYETRSRSGKGGGLEYYVGSFSALVLTKVAEIPSQPISVAVQSPNSLNSVCNQTHSLKSTKDETPLAALRAEGDAKAAHAQGKAQIRMDARLEILRQFNQFCRENPMEGGRKSDGSLQKESFAAAWNRGEIDSAAREVFPRLSGEKLHRWVDGLRRNGLYRLAGRYGNRKGCGLIDSQPQLAAALRALIFEYPHVTARIAHDWLCARYAALPAAIAGDGPLVLPSFHSTNRWLKAWKSENAEFYTRLRNPDDWKNKYMVGWGDASAAIVRLNQVWEFDSTPADVMLQDGRHSLLGVIDVYSRRVRLHVSKTSRATAVASLLRGALIEWGVPEIAKTDNGQEYVSQHLIRIFDALEIDHRTSAPFSPWQKPFIERFFRSFSHHLMEYLPGYIGHNVAEREALRAREQFSDRLFTKDRVVKLALTADQLQRFCDGWLQGYHARPHDGLDGARPLDRVAAWPEPPRRVANERVLDLLLSEAPSNGGLRTVTKSYCLMVDRYQYNAAELALHVGQSVRVLYDPEGDMGKVYVFDGKGQFICVADCPEVTGTDRRQMAVDARLGQRLKARDDYRTAKAEARLINGQIIPADLLPAPSEPLALPAPTESHNTRAIQGAQDALDNKTALHIGQGFTPQQARAQGYLDDLKADAASKKVLAEPVPIRKPASEFDDLRDLFNRTYQGQFGPGDAESIARFYEVYRSPKMLETTLIEAVGWEAFYAWKTAALAQARQTAATTQTA